MTRRVKEYTGHAIQVRYDVARCIHAAECVRGLPAVFDSDRRPWIDPNAAAADEVAATIHACPTGALTYERTDGGTGEPPAEENTITLGSNGPLYARGKIELRRPDGSVIATETRVALCRCGGSNDKPYCDGRHAEIGFTDPGAVVRPPKRQAEPGSCGLAITVASNGPLLVRGPFRVVDAGGDPRSYQDKAALCRCGKSGNRPYCDGTHGKVGFAAD